VNPTFLLHFINPLIYVLSCLLTRVFTIIINLNIDVVYTVSSGDNRGTFVAQLQGVIKAVMSLES